MKTKVVYVIISSESDIYLEQLWVSVFSLKKHTPSVNITIVSDHETAIRLNNPQYASLKSLIDDVIEISFESYVSGKERSRFLKTNLRKFIKGDFLFLDTDTIITDNLCEIDNINVDIGIVLDLHCKFISHPFEKEIRYRVENLFNQKLKIGTDYYNSGVMFVRDTEKAHAFFDEWHKNWLSVKDMQDGIFDQQSLVYTIDKIGIVCPLDGSYNCQILGSVEYLVSAKIVHFFNTQWGTNPISPFLEKNFYEKIKKEQGISKQTEEMIMNCREYFCSPSMPLGLEDMKLWLSPSFTLMRKIGKRKKLAVVVNRICELVLNHKIF